MSDLCTIFSLLASTHSAGNGISSSASSSLRSLPADSYRHLLLSVIEDFVTKLARLQEGKKLSNTKKTSFEVDEVPEISVGEYLGRIVKYTNCSSEAFVVSLIFLDRLYLHNKYLVTWNNVHRLLLTSILISSKLLDDYTFNNKYFSYVGGVALLELNQLEMEFLKLLKFDLCVRTEAYESYCAELELQCIIFESALAHEDGYCSSSQKEEVRAQTSTSEPKSVLKKAALLSLSRSCSFNAPHEKKSAVTPLRKPRKGRSSSLLA